MSLPKPLAESCEPLALLFLKEFVVEPSILSDIKQSGHAHHFYVFVTSSGQLCFCLCYILGSVVRLCYSILLVLFLVRKYLCYGLLGNGHPILVGHA